MKHPEVEKKDVTNGAGSQAVAGEQKVVEAARRVFEGQEESWLTAGLVYFKLCRFPKTHGLDRTPSLLPDKFEKLIEHCGHFDVERKGKELLIRPRKETWPH